MTDMFSSVVYRRDQPSKVEKMAIAQCIVDTFPVLRDPLTGGFVCSLVAKS